MTSATVKPATAAQTSHSDTSNGVLQFVSFRVASEEFGVEILKVHEIIRFTQLTRVPNLPRHVEGVFNLRGKVIPVIGLRQVIGLEKLETNNATRIVVASVKDEILGIVVDSVSEVLRIARDTVEPAPRLREGHGGYVAGIGKLEDRLLLLLDLDHLLSEEETADLATLSDSTDERTDGESASNELSDEERAAQP